MGTLSETVHHRYLVRAAEDVGAVRRAVAALAAGLDGVRPGEAELAATELATNLIRHATAGGHLLVRLAGPAVELIAVDDGPGARPGRLPERPYGDWSRSPPLDPLVPFDPLPLPLPGPGGGLGVGLAGVERLASVFDCYTSERGTVVLARIGSGPATRAGALWWGGVNVPLLGDGESGDAWAVEAGLGAGQRLGAAIVDGLGHGPEAAAAAAAAVTAFHVAAPDDPVAYLRRAHEAMRNTRGGVLAACQISTGTGELAFTGLGNITGQVLAAGKKQGLASLPGTAGTQLAPPRSHLTWHSWGPGATLILATDGLRSGWDLASYPGLLRHEPAVIAATVHRDYARGTDDACVLVVTDTRAEAS